MTACFVYITAPDAELARRIGRMLVEERLAACANVLDGMTSIFHWDGKVQEEGEAVLIAKTRAALVPALTQRVKDMHSYSCPCVVSWRLDAGNPDFLAWIEAETQDR